MEPWKDLETLKTLYRLEQSEDNKRIINRCIKYLEGSRQAPTTYMWQLMKSIYEQYFEVGE